MRVHTGTAGQERRPCAWVETAITYEWEWTELFYGLGSKYFRDNVAEDDELESDRPGDLPESITQAALLRIVRDEYRKWGTNNIGSWGDEISERRMQYAMAWLKELIFEAFPEMRGYDT